jgi:DMSO/TMAO reductase YedYZ molybdopterin-dependent catalytic subunit
MLIYELAGQPNGNQPNVTRFTRRRFIELTISATLAACANPSPAPQANPLPVTASPAAVVPQSSPTVALRPAPPLPSTEITITSTDSFYIQSYDVIPEVKTEAWTLTLDGLVDTPLKFTLADIKALPVAKIMRTLECIGNPVGGPQIGNTIWKGTYLKPLFDEAGIKPAATHVKFTAADQYQTAIALNYINDECSFLAYEMNGEPLTPDHGFPLRVFFAGSYGQKMPKWVTRLEFIDQDFRGYWEEQGWSNTAQVQTNSILKQPRSGSYARQPLPIWGVAYAGDRDITKVEVKIAGGDWQAAQLLAGPTNEVWTQWSLNWTPERAGDYKLQVRATDATGYTQMTATTDVLDGYPDGPKAIQTIYIKIIDG